MRLLNSDFEFCDYDDSPPPYAILSHTWSERNEEEVTYQDLKDGIKDTTKPLTKLNFCKDRAKEAGYKYFWIDTCCIDKRNDAEVNYAIRSMWRWYFEAGVCFVYLSDLSKKRTRDTDWRDALKDCRWFTRGWTLQELIASKKIEFYARDGHIGSREDLLPALRSITGIDLGRSMPSHATRLGWVTKRSTKRPEDRAYCMLGICDVSLDPRYGEGGNSAWRRLQDAITHRHGTIALSVQREVTNDDHPATMLEALRFDALETRRKTVKEPLTKTCKWILAHPACAKWLKLERKFFWIKGKPGAGKSVLIKYLDQHVTRKLKKSNAIGLHFYFNARGEQLEKSFMGLYRSLLVQLVDLVPEVAHELNALGMPFDLPQLQSVLTSVILSIDRQVWLFIDALDECREGDVRDLIEFLDGLQDAKLYVCLASRHYPIVKVPTDLQLVLEDVDQHKEDLSTYVQKLDLEGEELAQMQHDIVAKANGIFLWVVLVVNILQKDVERGRFHAMQSRLREIPEGLPDLFKTIILRDDEHKEEFLLCLRWILYARRPLTLKEWYFAMMSGVDGSLEWHGGITDPRMEIFLLTSSKGLAELTKGKTTTAQFIHESVRDFLIDQGGFEEICGSHESFESVAHDHLKRYCLRGMAFSLPRQLDQRKGKKQLLNEEERSSLRARYPFAEYATTYILHHADQAAVGCPQDSFLANEFTISDWMSGFNALQTSKPVVYSDVPSLNYLCAERNLASLGSRPTAALKMEKQQRYVRPLIAAIVHASWDVLRIFLNDMSVPNIEETILEIRSKTKLVLSSRWGLNRVWDWSWAVRNGLVHLSKHTLTSIYELDPGAQKMQWSQALVTGSEGGHEGMVQMLLDMGTEFHEYAHIEALYNASDGGHEKAVQVLLDAGATVNGRLYKSSTALQVASSKGHERVVQVLVNAGADASQCGHENVVQLLLDAGADVNAEDGSRGTALRAAAVSGHDTVVQMLLDAGANVNFQGGPHGNVLVAASVCGYESVVQMLLNAGADASAQGGDYSNALEAARSNNQADAVSACGERNPAPNKLACRSVRQGKQILGLSERFRNFDMVQLDLSRLSQENGES
ncbi:unnamed protein product [Cercospora beticola]|nr:unnamed protein product [Cercospora beticola]